MKRKSFTVKEKLEAVKKLRDHDGNISLTARNIGISTKMLRNWQNNEQHFVKSKKTVTLKIGSGFKFGFQALKC
jgi:transposase-like protein